MSHMQDNLTVRRGADVLDSAARTTAKPGAAWWAVRLSPLLAAVVVFLVGVPLARDQFSDFGTTLPALTMWLLEARRQIFTWHVGTARGAGGMALGRVLLSALVVLVGFAAGLLVRAGRSRGAGVTLFWMGLVLLVAQVAALAVPLVAMMRAMPA